MLLFNLPTLPCRREDKHLSPCGILLLHSPLAVGFKGKQNSYYGLKSLVSRYSRELCQERILP